MSTLNEQTFGQEKPYKAEQDGAREQLLAEIAEALKPPEPRKGAFTAKEIAEASGISLRQAVARLHAAVKDGTMGREEVGKQVYFYKIKDGKDG